VGKRGLSPLDFWSPSGSSKHSWHFNCYNKHVCGVVDGYFNWNKTKIHYFRTKSKKSPSAGESLCLSSQTFIRFWCIKPALNWSVWGLCAWYDHFLYFWNNRPSLLSSSPNAVAPPLNPHWPPAARGLRYLPPDRHVANFLVFFLRQ